ncbi:MAG: ECF-type sigma factor [Acidobacteriota bacterium]
MDLTQLLADWRKEGRAGLDSALPMIYDELHQLARHHLSGAGATPTLQPTVLVHEAYLRLTESQPQAFAGRRQFFAYASRIIRHILVDHIRAKQSDKRGAGQVVHLADVEPGPGREGLSPEMLLAVHGALNRLEAVDSRQARIVEMKFFGGMRQAEIARALEISLPTVERHWSAGRRRLALFLQSPSAEGVRGRQ